MNEQTIAPILDEEDEKWGDTSYTLTWGNMTPLCTELGESFTASSMITPLDRSTLSRRLDIRPKQNPIIRRNADVVTLLEKWEGFVSEILDDGFRAIFRRNSSDFQELVAEFDYDDLCNDDIKILAIGMPLIWSITRESRKGGVQRCSTLVLRRQPREMPTEGNGFLNSLNEWIQSGETVSPC